MVNYELVKDTIQLLAEFNSEMTKNPHFEDNVDGFKKWIYHKIIENNPEITEPEWEGKSGGRSAESVISTLLVHMNKYAKNYSKSAIHGSPFSTQEEFIFLITLKSFGSMSKIELIKKNVQDKPGGIKIIDRLIKMGWAEQVDSTSDKRSKVISITQKGLDVLENQMDKIRQATHLVSGNLTHKEKLELIRLLLKLENFHQSIYSESIATNDLLNVASENLL